MAIGRLMDLLTELDTDDETIVFFTSDSGGAVPNERLDVLTDKN